MSPRRSYDFAVTRKQRNTDPGEPAKPDPSPLKTEPAPQRNETEADRPPPQLALWVAWSADPDRIGKTVPFETGPKITIGREPGPEGLAIPRDRWLSSRHLTVEMTRHGARSHWEITDQSANGTFVNGKRVKSATLSRGDVVRCGATVLILDEDPQIVAEGYDPLGLVGASAGLEDVRADIRRYATSRVAVHVYGESGVGKELVATALHEHSGAKGSFIKVNVATLVPNLMDSQLFGHVRGAFTGADHDHQGFFERADGGTLFLDEIAELEPALQAKLLRVVEYGEVFPVGASDPRRVDVRIVSATHRDLEQWVEEDKFREDLYWRIANLKIFVPPLASRRLDVTPLVDHFLAEAGAPRLASWLERDANSPWHIAEMLEKLIVYTWPGNVRELRGEIGAHLADATRDAWEAESRFPAFGRCLSRKLRSFEPDVAEAPAKTIDRERIETAFTSPKLLRALIQESTGGNKKEFAELAAKSLDRPWDSVRRKIYHVLKAEEREHPAASLEMSTKLSHDDD